MTTTLAQPIKCKHCPASTRSNMAGARFLGWRFFDGMSMTGKKLSDVVCPACAGTATPTAEAAPAPSWRVRCRNCGWEYEDEFDDGPLSAKEAKEMARDHDCEPEVDIAPPGGDQWYRTYQVKDDGSLDERYSS